MGRVIAGRLAADGFDVAVAYVGEMDLADAAVSEIKAHGRSGAAFAADIADEGAVSDLFDAIDDRFGRLDVVVHTAGINRPAVLTDLDLADFDAIHRVNVRGTFVVNQQAARRARDGGSIVNVSSSERYRAGLAAELRRHGAVLRPSRAPVLGTRPARRGPVRRLRARTTSYPPVQHEPRIQQLSDGLEKLGLHPFHLPLGVQLTQDTHGRATTDSPCILCDRVDGFPCLLGAKADAEWAVIRPALAAHPNLALMTRTTVERLITDSSGHSVSGVAVTLPDGSPHVFTADIIVLSAGAILSAALLLKSASGKHPQGLANSSDMVGRNYMRHNNLALIAFSREPNPTVFQKTLALNDFYHPSEHWQYPMGNIQMLGKSDDWQIKGAAPRPLGWAPSAPYGEVAKHSIDFWLSSEDIPLPDSRITLRRDGAIRLVGAAR